MIKGVTFLGSKIGKLLQVCGRAHFRGTRKNLESRTQLDQPVECASGGDPLLLYKILHLPFFPLVRIVCALRLESREKNYQHGLDAGPWEFVSSAKAISHQPVQNSVALFRGHKQNTRSHRR